MRGETILTQSDAASIRPNTPRSSERNALGTDPARLLGIHPPEQDTVGAEQLRRAVRAFDLPDFAEPVEVLALPELHDAAWGAWSDYLAGPAHRPYSPGYWH